MASPPRSQETDDDEDDLDCIDTTSPIKTVVFDEFEYSRPRGWRPKDSDTPRGQQAHEDHDDVAITAISDKVVIDICHNADSESRFPQPGFEVQETGTSPKEVGNEALMSTHFSKLINRLYTGKTSQLKSHRHFRGIWSHSNAWKKTIAVASSYVEPQKADTDNSGDIAMGDDEAPAIKAPVGEASVEPTPEAHVPGVSEPQAVIQQHDNEIMEDAAEVNNTSEQHPAPDTDMNDAFSVELQEKRDLRAKAAENRIYQSKEVEMEDASAAPAATTVSLSVRAQVAPDRICIATDTTSVDIDMDDVTAPAAPAPGPDTSPMDAVEITPVPQPQRRRRPRAPASIFLPSTNRRPAPKPRILNNDVTMGDSPASSAEDTPAGPAQQAATSEPTQKSSVMAIEQPAHRPMAKPVSMLHQVPPTRFFVQAQGNTETVQSPRNQGPQNALPTPPTTPSPPPRPKTPVQLQAVNAQISHAQEQQHGIAKPLVTNVLSQHSVAPTQSRSHTVQHPQTQGQQNGAVRPPVHNVVPPQMSSGHQQPSQAQPAAQRPKDPQRAAASSPPAKVSFAIRAPELDYLLQKYSPHLDPIIVAIQNDLYGENAHQEGLFELGPLESIKRHMYIALASHFDFFLDWSKRDTAMGKARAHLLQIQKERNIHAWELFKEATRVEMEVVTDLCPPPIPHNTKLAIADRKRYVDDFIRKGVWAMNLSPRLMMNQLIKVALEREEADLRAVHENRCTRDVQYLHKDYLAKMKRAHLWASNPLRLQQKTASLQEEAPGSNQAIRETPNGAYAPRPSPLAPSNKRSTHEENVEHAHKDKRGREE